MPPRSLLGLLLALLLASPAFQDDGRITAEERASGLVMARTVRLSGGEVFVAPQEASAEGRVVIPRDLCRGDLVR